MLTGVKGKDTPPPRQIFVKLVNKSAIKVIKHKALDPLGISAKI
jgi:hypothetical protein